MTTEDSKQRGRRDGSAARTAIRWCCPTCRSQTWKPGSHCLRGVACFPPGIKERNRDTILTATASLIADNCREMRKLMGGDQRAVSVAQDRCRGRGQLAAQPSEPRLIKRSKHVPPRRESPNAEPAKLGKPMGGEPRF